MPKEDIELIIIISSVAVINFLPHLTRRLNCK